MDTRAGFPVPAESPSRPRRPRALRFVLCIFVPALGLFALALTGAVVFIQGETAGRLITKVVGGIGLGGQIEVRALHWPARILLDLVTDAPTPLLLEGVRITDPDGVVVLDAPRLELKLPPRSATRARIKLHDVKIGPDTFWRFADLKDGSAIGFLAAVTPRPEPKPGASDPATRPPEPAAPPTDEEGFLIQIVNAELDGFSAQFDYPGAWGLLLSDIKGKATLHVEGDFVGFDCTELDARKGGHLTVLTETLPFDRVRVTRVATTREWKNDIFLEVAGARTGRSTLTAKGFFTHIYDGGPAGIDMHAEIDDAANALDSASGPLLDLAGDLEFGGNGAKVILDLKDPFDRLVIDGSFAGLDVRRESAQARGLGFDLHFASAPLVVETKSLSFKSPSGGRLTLGARLWEADTQAARPGMNVSARVELEQFGTAAYLPRQLQAQAAGFASGTLEADLHLASTGPTGSARIERLELRRARAAGLPETVSVAGSVEFAADKVETRGLRVQIPGASAQARGQVDLAKQVGALTVHAAARDLGRALRPFGVPHVARSANVNLSVTGHLDNPTVAGSAHATNVGVAPGPILPEVRARFRFDNGTARLDHLVAELLGGTLSASGAAKLFARGLERPLKSPVVTARVAGRALDLTALLPELALAGRLSFDAAADGPVDALTAELSLPPGTELVFMKERFRIEQLQVIATAQDVKIEALAISRAGGGVLELTGGMGLMGQRPLALQIALRDFPIGGLPGLAASGAALDGTLSASLQVSGNLATPHLDGTIRLANFGANGVALGDARLAFETLRDGRVALRGRLFDLFDLRGHARMRERGPEMNVELAFSGLALEKLLERADLPAGFRSRLTGSVSVKLGPDQPLAVEARMTDLWLALDERLAALAGNTPYPLAIRNEGDIVARWSGEEAELEMMKLVTEGGEFQLGGKLVGNKLDVETLGQLDLEFLQPFLSKHSAELRGSVVLGLKAKGPVDAPALTGTIAITRPIHLISRAIGLPIDIPSGMINVKPGSVHLHNLAVQVDDSLLAIQGSAEHTPGFEPTRFSLDTEGELSARLLSVLVPGAVTESSGTFVLRGRIAGTPEAPDFNALLEARDVTLRLRDVGRRLTVESADLRLNAREMELTNVRVQVDGQGLVTIGAAGTPPGRVVFERLFPEPKIRVATVPIRGEHLTFVQRGIYDVDDLGFDLVFEGDFDKHMALAGEVRVVSGRVTWDFDVSNLVVTPRIVEGYGRPAPPNPLIDNMALNLTVRTIGDTFVVQNNLAPELYLLIDLNVGGTVGRPRVSGNLRPTDGRFHIIGLRGNFDLVPGGNYITFVPTKSIEDLETPELLIDAENLVIDNSGQEHVIRMRIRGPVGMAAITFSSDSGLNQNEILLLLLSGQTSTSQVRFGASNPTLGRTGDVGTALAGQATRDVFATMLEPYIADTLALITGERLALRPTIGSDGLEMRLFGRFSRQLRLQLNYLQGFQSHRRARGEIGLWLADFVTLRSFGEYLQFSQQQGIIETFSSVNLELSVEYPLRLPWP